MNLISFMGRKSVYQVLTCTEKNAKMASKIEQ